MAVIKTSTLAEGELICKYFDNRFRRNKNILGVNLGGTGSGKSYRDLRIAELWYEYKFKKKFPLDNICFGVYPAMKLLSEGKLKKGEFIIFEEAGVNMGSLDFQNRVSKMFSYILQSFRSMNIGVLFNLPYLSMLNKQARMLLHYSMESAGIDPTKKMNKCKPKFHQVNQTTGKIYKKYLRVYINGKVRKIKTMSFEMPSEELWKAYEAKKHAFISTITGDYKMELKKQAQAYQEKIGRKKLTEMQIQVFKLRSQGLKQDDISKKMNISTPSVCQHLKAIQKKGYEIPKMKVYA